MRVIAIKTLNNYLQLFPEAADALLSWYQEVTQAAWTSPNELKLHFKSASVITGKRVVFNINGNKYRLIVDIEFRLKIAFVVWFGTHALYDKINAKTVRYDKAN